MRLRKPSILAAAASALLFAQVILAVHAQNTSEALTINVKKGLSFTVTLNSNPTTGYQWKLARPLNSKLVKLVSSRYIPSAPKRTGSGGVEKWTFSALGKGKTTISFNYARPWEKDTPPAESKTFTVNIR